MLELIKAEMVYRKWSHLTDLALPFLIVPLNWWLQSLGGGEVDYTFGVMFGFGATLVLLFLRIPTFTHKTSMEENRIHLLATLPVPIAAVAMSQSLPFLILTSALSVLGFLTIGVFNLGYGNLPLVLMANCVLLVIALGLLSIFLKELLTLLPRWAPMMLWVLFVGLVVLKFSVDFFLSPNQRIFDLQQMSNWVGTVKFLALAAVCFFGHIALFTRWRDDFSVRRRYP